MRPLSAAAGSAVVPPVVADRRVKALAPTPDEVSGRGRTASPSALGAGPADGGAAGARAWPGSAPTDPSETARRRDCPPLAADGSVFPAAADSPDDPSGEDRF
ncbi:hypothetical protein ACWCQW_46565 [Streptomyces mirabilis]